MVRKHALRTPIALIPFVLFALVMGVANADITSNLVAHWSFDDGAGDTALDSSGSGLNGTLQGGPQWVEGHLQGALQFDGVDDYVTAPHIPFDNRTFTIAMWINPVLYTDQQIVFSQRQTSATDTDMHFRLGGPGGTAPVPGAVRMGFYSNDLDTAGGIVEDNNWYHITFWYDFANQDRRIYVNGVQQAQGASTPYLGTSGDTVIGSWAGSGQWIRGIIDEVRIYHRALSDEDIVELYNWVGGANAGDDQRVEAGTEVTLSGVGPADATSFTWEQIIVGDEPAVTLADPNSATTTFTPPVRTIGYVLTFRLTVESPTTGTTSDEVLVEATAPNAPTLVPQNFRTYPGHLSYRLEWDRQIDAVEYGVGFKMGENLYFWFWTENNYYDLLNLQEGSATIVAVVARNGYGEGPRSSDITLVPMRNYALPATLGGTIPPLDYVYVISHYTIADMNNKVIQDDTNDSWDGVYKTEDYWGYTWANPMLMDHVVYFTGSMFGDGGWFLDLTVQYTKDGTEWINVPTTIVPPYNFTDQRPGRGTYERFDLGIPTLLGTGIRIFGTPGGTATFTSIAELEVLADHKTARPLIVQGIDAEIPERSTGTIDASFSFSTRGDITSMLYEQTGGPSVTITITGDPLIATFDAPAVDADTELVFQITGSDGTDTLSDDVTITVKNLMTTAVAGPDQSVEEGAAVTLDGSASVTTTGTLTYQWTQTSGNPVTLNNATSATADFEAPVIWDYAEALVFQLEVNDGAGGVSTDEVTVHVLNSALLLGLGTPLGTGWVQDVLVLGENYESRILSTATNEDQLAVVGGEANVTPLPGDTVDLSGTGYDSSETPLVWTPMHRDDGWWFDNRSGRGCVQDNFIGYFHLYVISLAEQEARLRYANDDDMRGWNNGERILAVGCCTGDSASGTFTLSAGINSMTFKVTEYGGDNYMAVRFTDRYNTPLTGLYYSLSVPIPPSQAYAVRDLPASYDAGGTVEVTLSMRVNPDDKPSGVTISEPIPAGLTVVDAGGGTQIGNSLNWSFSGGAITTQVLNYTLGVPAGASGAVPFTGTVAFEGTTENILGDNMIYEIPSAPETIYVEMLVQGHVSWSASPQEGVIGYRVYRSENGQPWEQIGSASGTSFTDGSIVEGNTYNYQIAAVNAAGVEGNPSAPTGEKMIVMEIREAENYNHSGGLWPGYQNCPAAIEAPDSATVGTPQQYDFFYATDIPAGDARLDYRPNDNCGTELREATVNIGWITIGDWWRYTVNVPAPGPNDPPEGWVRIVLKVAYNGTVDLYWDETLVDSLTFLTGDWGIFQDVSNEQYFQTTPGIHTLRVVLASGGMNFDTIGMGFNWSAPTREDLFADDFESYTTLYSFADLVGAGYTVNNGSGAADGAWRLWNTGGDFLGAEDPAIAAMTSNYVITDSDLAGDVDVDEELITPNIDCTQHRSVRLDFNMNYRPYHDDIDHLQIAEVDIRSSDDGVTWGDWVNLLGWDTSTVAADYETGPQQADISAYADGKIIQVRWHFYQANYDYWFAIDDIRVSGDRLPLTSGKIINLGYAAGVADLTWEAFGGGNYTVDYTGDLTSGTWDPVPGVTWPITATTWSGNINAIFGQGVYLRVRSE